MPIESVNLSGVVVLLLFCNNGDDNGIGDDCEDANSGYKKSDNLNRCTSKPTIERVS